MALSDFIKKNVADQGAGDFIRKDATENLKGTFKGAAGKAFVAFDIANLVTSEHKIKSIFKIMRDLVFFKPITGSLFAGLFLGMGKAVRSLVHDTGSLEAALQKLSQIQSLHKVFAPLLGGADAAKTKVAELVNFAATRNIKLGDAAEATRSLSVMTKNGYSSSAALDTVNDAAEATGNSIVGLANAIGEFSSQLQGGGSIAGATEQLRQMGVISNGTADSLNQLQENGASAGQIFGTLTTSLEEFKGAAAAASDDIDKVNQAYETASANLQQKFGSPWVESDVQNTKNLTAAMNGIAPSVERVSSAWAILFNAFSTTKSSFLKIAAENKTATGAVEALTYAFTGLVTAGGLVGAVKVTAWLGGLATGAEGGLVAITALTGGIGVFAALAVAAIGIGLQIGDAFERSAKAIQDLATANNQADNAILKQILSVKTLTDRHNAQAAAMDRVIEAQKALTKAREEGDPRKIAEQEAALARAQKNARAAQKIAQGPGPAEEEAARGKVQREKQVREQRFQEELAVASPEIKSQMLRNRAATATAKAVKGETGEQARIAFERDSEAASGQVKAAQSRLEQAQEKVKQAEIALQHAGDRPEEAMRVEQEATSDKAAAEKEVRQAQRAVAEAQRKQTEVGANAPAGTSVALEQQRTALDKSNIPEPEKLRKLSELNLAIARAKSDEEERTQNQLIAQQAQADQKELDRQLSLDKIRVQTESQISSLKEDGFARTEKETALRLHLLDAEEAAEKAKGQNADEQALAKIAGQRSELNHSQKLAREQIALTKMGVQSELDMQDAQIAHDSKRQRILKNNAVFLDKFSQLRGQGFGQEEAGKLAQRFAENAIKLDVSNTEKSLSSAAVADSLTKIGGGGGIYTPGGGDPMLTVLQQSNRLHEDEIIILRMIAASEHGIQ